MGLHRRTKWILILLIVVFPFISYGQAAFVGMPIFGVGTPVSTCQTLNATYKGTSVVLSNSNMTYSTVTAGTLGSVCGTLNKTTGDWYFEFKCTAKGAGTTIGIVTSNSSFAVNNYIGHDVYGYAYYSNFGGFYHNGSPNFFTFPDDYTGGDYVGIAIHFAGASSTFKAYKNGVLEGTQTINISSMYVAAGGTTASGDLDLPTPVYSAPSGYTVMCN